MSDTTTAPAPAADDKPVFKKILLSHNKLGLSAPSPAEGKTARLVWDFRNNNPRITIYTGDPQDSTEANPSGAIIAHLDLPVFYAYLELIKKIISTEGECKDVIDNWNFTYENDVKSDKATKQTELWVGRDKEGNVWTSVVASNRPRIRFNFAPTNFHFFRHGDGTEFSKAEIGNIFAKGYVSLLTQVVAATANELFVPVEAPPRQFPKREFNKGNYQGGGGGGYQKKPWQGNNGGGGGGNYNRNNGGGGGYNRSGGGGYNKGGYQGGGGYQKNNGGAGNYSNNTPSNSALPETDNAPPETDLPF